MNPLTILAILDGVLLLMLRVPSLVAGARELRAEVQAMREANRDPSPEEWDAVGRRVDDLLVRLQD